MLTVLSAHQLHYEIQTGQLAVLPLPGRDQGARRARLPITRAWSAASCPSSSGVKPS
jgi:hypothetical protein